MTMNEEEKVYTLKSVQTEIARTEKSKQKVKEKKYQNQQKK